MAHSKLYVFLFPSDFLLSVSFNLHFVALFLTICFRFLSFCSILFLSPLAFCSLLSLPRVSILRACRLLTTSFFFLTAGERDERREARERERERRRGGLDGEEEEEGEVVGSEHVVENDTKRDDAMSDGDD